MIAGETTMGDSRRERSRPPGEPLLALVTALSIEAAFVKRRMRVERVLPGATWRAYLGTLHGCRVLLVKTGMGRQRAEAAIRFVMEQHPIDVLISFGFAGALTDDLDVGDTVLPSVVQVVRDENPEESAEESYPIENRLFEQATNALMDAGIRVQAGVLVTAEQPVFSPDDKRRLGSDHHADIVDMETFWIAQIVSHAHVPLIALRAVSDTVQDAMLPFDRMMSDQGRWKWRQTTAFFLCRPWRLALPLRLYANARRAARSLAVSVDRLASELASKEA